ncbi:hypothetical protein [Brevibacillus sp. IT-7CA2]|uniref:hypothetical protein n=1 Tax=Brevibacillus sp. IT-7CA2 TaxID=3026436 RepID=UPI0039DF3CCF
MRLYLAFSFFLYGDEPRILAWHFFGYSRFYEIFIGIAELACALLLLFPRTRTIAAICLFPISLNITIVNFEFDISAQVYSLLLTVMCGLLLWGDRKKTPFLTMVLIGIFVVTTLFYWWKESRVK